MLLSHKHDPMWDLSFVSNPVQTFGLKRGTQEYKKD